MITMLTIEDVKNCGFDCSWTMLHCGIPYDFDRTEAVKFAVEQCLNGVDDALVSYVAGLSNTDEYEISRSVRILASRENVEFKIEKKKLSIIKVDKAFKECLSQAVVKSETEKIQDLIELWIDSGCPPYDGISFFSKYDYFPSEQFYRYKYKDLCMAVSEWLDEEVEACKNKP